MLSSRIIICILASFLSTSRAQNWTWDLSPETKNATLFNFLTFNEAHVEQCQSLTLQWNADGSSTGPYTVFAYPIAAPANFLIQKSQVAHALAWDAGSGPSTTIKIPWTYHTVDGFMVTVMDSKGNYGNVSSRWLPLPDDKTFNPSCSDSTHSSGIATTPDSFHISYNRNLITTCDPVGIALYGGERPYTITIVGVDTPAPLNKTLSEFDTFYTWVPEEMHNSKNQNTSVIIFASDKIGQTTLSTPLIQLNVDGSRKCSDTSGGSPNIPQNFRPIGVAFPTSTSPTPSVTTRPPSSSVNSNTTKQLSPGTTAGIVVGVIFGIALIATIITRRVRRLNTVQERPTAMQYYSTVPLGPAGYTRAASDSNVSGYSAAPVVRTGRAVNRPEEDGVQRERDGGRALNPTRDDGMDGPHELLPPSYRDATSHA